MVEGVSGKSVFLHMLLENKSMLDSQTDKKLWNIAWDMWEHRNGALHNLEEAHQSLVESKMSTMINQINNLGPQGTILCNPKNRFSTAALGKTGMGGIRSQAMEGATKTMVNI